MENEQELYVLAASIYLVFMQH